jgi:tRNA pseudouridine65 synthase
MITLSDILYEDDEVIAVLKPAGIFVHRTSFSPEKKVLLQTVRDLIGTKLWPIHRLDRATSGVILFAKTPLAAKQLSLDFSLRRVEKHYLAIVRGYMEANGKIDYPLGDPKKQPKEAITEYQSLGKMELPIPVGRYATARYSLIRVIPVTGRRHQIRKHMSHISHPIIGDTTYGEGRHNRLFRNEFGISRLLLFAHKLSFKHPRTNHQVNVLSPFDPVLDQLFSCFGWPDKKEQEYD